MWEQVRVLAQATLKRKIRNDHKHLSPDPRKLPNNRQSGSPFQGDHVAYFYQESDSLLEALCDFIGGALHAGSAAIIIATKMHRDGLRQQLTDRGLDIHKAGQQRRYVELDASDVLSSFMVEGMPDGGLFEEIIGDFTRSCAGLASA